MQSATSVLPGLLLVTLFIPIRAAGDVSLPAIFSDGMVLQQKALVPIWGRGAEGERVTVRFQGQRLSTITRDGTWSVSLRNLRSGGPWRLEVNGKRRIVIDHVLVGEVWVCSGQSNMAASVSESHDAAREIAEAGNSSIRLFRVARLEAEKASDPQLLTPEQFRFVRRVQREAPDGRRTANWEETGPATVPRFSAVCYFFGRELQKSRRVPVGLIDASVGATPIEAWMSYETLQSDPQLKQLLDSYPEAMAKFRQQQQAAQSLASTNENDAQNTDQIKQPWRPGGLYNGMIAPLQPYAISGVVWWQGEANVNRADLYRVWFPKLIAGWRHAWRQGDFPFLFVQLSTAGTVAQSANQGDIWGRPALAWAELREAQRKTLKRLPKLGMVVITDLGGDDYHPKWKQPVGERLALAARAIAYGEQIVFSGPVFKSMKIDGAKIIIDFNHVGSGLTVRGTELTGFALAGVDRIFHDAMAEIKGNQVVLISPKVRKPLFARYGWAAHPRGNLFNKEGLPASPFKSH